MAAIEIRTVEEATALRALAGDWEDLADRCAAWPCQHPGWLDAWYGAFGRGRLEVVTAWTDGTLTGVMPLVRRGRTLRSPTNWHTARFGALASGRREHAVLADVVIRRSLPLRISLIHRGDATSSELRRSAEASGRRVVLRALPPSPYLQTSGDRASWWDGLTARLRRELQRRGRRLEEQGRVAVEVHESSGAAEAYLEEGFAIEGSGWKERKGTAIRSRPETLGFYRRIAAWAAARGALRLAFLRLNDEAIAFDLALEDPHRHYLLKTGFDHRFASFAPGQLLRRAMIERAFAQGLESYEFLGVPEPWKLAWTGTTRAREELVILPRSLRGRVLETVHRTWLPAARRMRTSPGRR